MREEFFPYRSLTHEVFGTIKIPLITVVLKGFNSVKLYAMVDTGAVISVFPRSVCDLLGLSYEDGKEAFLLSATQEEIPVRVHKIIIRIGEIEFEARVGFSEVEQIPHVLGGLDVLDKVEIKFEKDGVRFIGD
jgi:predicted aspartyl protease